MLTLTDSGFYCTAGDFYVDPWQPVKRAVVTHAHADHFARDCRAYLIAREGEHVFRLRLGESAALQAVDYGEAIDINGVAVSLHPAGHILGSAQVRLEHRGEVWVVSGDYKRDTDTTCTPFDVVRCHTFITEATFGLPIYRWPHQATVFDSIYQWWRANQESGKASLLYAYALGKAQRLLAGIDSSIGPIYTHGAVERLNQAYRHSGVALPPTQQATHVAKAEWQKALIIAPLSARGTPWVRRFGTHASGFVSGWMRIRGTRRRRAVDRGFVLSDHADWPALMQTISATGAQHIGVTHGYVPAMVRWLREQGLDAHGYQTRYEGEIAEEVLTEEEKEA